ncbi:MAG: hypothetical protein ABFD07_03015 [Methanobacterium sp.]
MQWYYNDTDYHKGKNQIIDQSLMNDKWTRELCYLTQMKLNYPDLVPEVLDIDLIEKKIYLGIDGVDFWQQTLDNNCSFDDILPDWQDQMLEILKAHKALGFYKYSLHPSSYFVVDGKLKSINYFFCHCDAEPEVPLSHFRSHISLDRQAKMEEDLKKNGLDWDSVLPYKKLQILAFESFRSNYPDEFIEKAKGVYVS